MLSLPTVSDQSIHCEGRLSRRPLSVLDLQGAPSAVAGPTGRVQNAVAPADAPDHERNIAGAADAADPACTSRSAFFLDNCMAFCLVPVLRSGARSCSDADGQEACGKEPQAGEAFTRQGPDAPSGPTVRPSVSTPSTPSTSAQSIQCEYSECPM